MLLDLSPCLGLRAYAQAYTLRNVITDCYNSVIICYLLPVWWYAIFSHGKRGYQMRYHVYEKSDLVLETNDLQEAIAKYKTCYAYGRLGGIRDMHMQGYNWIM